MILSKGSVLEINSGGSWYKVTEHNRSAIDVSPLRIEKVKRTANGTARKFFVAEKKRISVSWDMLPSTTALTVDGGWGATDLKSFYESSTGRGSFAIRLNYAKNGSSSYEPTINVMFADFSCTLVKRGVEAFWDVSMTLEEV
jgi:hypothetical protein